MDVDIDTIGRKELQALAKNFGIKANQKSVILRDELRQVIAAAVLKHDEGEKTDSNKEIANDQNPTNAEIKKEKIPEGNTYKSIELNQKIISRQEEFFLEATIGCEHTKEDKVSDAIPQGKKYSILENNDDDDKREQPEAFLEDNSIFCEGIKKTKKKIEGDRSVDICNIKCAFSLKNDNLTANICDSKEVKAAEKNVSIFHGDTKVIMEQSEDEEYIEGKKEKAGDHTVTKEKEDAKNARELKIVLNDISVINNGATIRTEEEIYDATIEATNMKALPTYRKETKYNYDDNEVAVEDDMYTEEHKNNRDGKEMEVIQQKILRNKKLSSGPDGKVLLSTKNSLGSEKHSNIQRDQKFNTKLDELYRKNKGMKQITNLPKRMLHQPIDQRLKALTGKEQKEVPLWKVHSKDFLRKRGADKTRRSNFKNNNHQSTKNEKTRPFYDRLNNKVELKASKTNGEKASLKTTTPKSLPMSKRNEEQMKKFLERQSIGRQDRAKKEQVKIYANCVRN